MITGKNLTAEKAAMIVFGIDDFNMSSMEKHSFGSLWVFLLNLEKMRSQHNSLGGRTGPLYQAMDGLRTEEELIRGSEDRKERDNSRRRELKEGSRLFDQAKSLEEDIHTEMQKAYVTDSNTVLKISEPVFKNDNKEVLDLKKSKISRDSLAYWFLELGKTNIAKIFKYDVTALSLNSQNKEIPAERAQRLSDWFKEEKKRGSRGAQARTATREGITRQSLKQILDRHDKLQK